MARAQALIDTECLVGCLGTQLEIGWMAGVLRDSWVGLGLGLVENRKCLLHDLRMRGEEGVALAYGLWGKAVTTRPTRKTLPPGLVKESTTVFSDLLLLD